MPRPSGTRHRPARARSSARRAVDPAAGDHEVAARRRVQPGDDLQRRGLARAVRARAARRPARAARRDRRRAAPRCGSYAGTDVAQLEHRLAARSALGHGHAPIQRISVPEVRGEDRVVAAGSRRAARGDDAAEVEHVDARRTPASRARCRARRAATAMPSAARVASSAANVLGLAVVWPDAGSSRSSDPRSRGERPARARPAGPGRSAAASTRRVDSATSPTRSMMLGGVAVAGRCCGPARSPGGCRRRPRRSRGP